MSQTLLRRLRSFSRVQWIVVGAFVLALAFTALFAVRTYRRAEFWRQHRDQPIAGWMRIGFVANSYHVPPPVLNRAIGLGPETRDPRPLNKIAEDQGRTFEELKAELEKAIADFRSNPHAPPEGRQ